MKNLDKAPDILDQAFAEWRKRETLKRGKTSVSKFADYLGYSQQAVSFWLNRDRKISEDAILEMLPKLAELLGEEIYDELQLPKPDKLYEYVTNNWNDTPIEEKKRIAKIIERYTNKPIPNGKEAEHTPKP